MTAYSSLGTTVNEDTNPLLNDPVIKNLSLKKHKKPAQILLMWALQKCYSVVPKSINPEHIKENIELEENVLNFEDIEMIDNLEKGQKYAWNAESVY